MSLWTSRVLQFRNELVFVRGVIGSDVTEDPQAPNRGSGAQAFASILWPSLATKLSGVNVQLEDGTTLGPEIRVIDLIRGNAIVDAGDAVNCFKITNKGDQETLHWIQGQ